MHSANAVKRSIELIRQAQFAACSYLGFDPYEEKYNHGSMQQVSTIDSSLPVELHLHHHHHHHCRENDDMLKQSSQLSMSADSPLGVGTLLSICDHIQLFQDAWQAHGGKADEMSQKFMLHGSFVKRDSNYSDFGAGLISNAERESRENSFSVCTDRYRNGGARATRVSAQTSTENHHINAAARISHYECSVLKEDNLSKGFGIRIGRTERSHPVVTSDLVTNPGDCGWIADPKHLCSSNAPAATNNAKVEQSYVSHSRDGNISSDSNHEPASGSNQKFGSGFTKRKKSINDISINRDRGSSSPSDASFRPYVDTRHVGHIQSVQSACTTVRKPLALQPPARGSFFDEGSDSQSSDTGRSTASFRSLRTDGLPLNAGTSVSCGECTCQQSLSTPRPFSSSHEERRETKESQKGSVKDLKRGFDYGSSKQYDLSEKIIGLDESENDKVHTLRPVIIRQEKNLVKRPNQVLPGKVGSTFAPFPSSKVPEEWSGIPGWEDTNSRLAQSVKTQKGGDSNSLRNSMSSTPRNEKVLAHCGVAEKDQLTQDFKTSNANIRVTRMCGMGYQPHGVETMHKNGISQSHYNDQDVLEDGVPARELVQSRSDMNSKSSLKSFSNEVRQESRSNNSSSPENVGVVNKKIQVVAMGKSNGFFQAGENEHILSEASTPKRTIQPKEYITQDGLRAHQQLECEMIRHEFSKKELEHVKKDYEDFLRNLGVDKNIQNTDGFSRLCALLQDREKTRLNLELEARLAAEEKARIYEASAEAAESRLLQLLDERTKIHLKFDEELEQKEAERIQLRALFEKERQKSEAAKKELQDLKEKFVSLLTKASITSEGRQEDSRDISLSPRRFFNLSEALEKRDVVENRSKKDPSKHSNCSIECRENGDIHKNIGMMEGPMTDRGIQSSREACISQQVRQQDVQVKTPESALQALERKPYHVEPDKTPLKQHSDALQIKYTKSKHIEKSTQTSVWNDGVYENFSCIYQSPIFEHNHKTTNNQKGFMDESSETDSDERVPNSRGHSDDHADIALCQLTQQLENIGADRMIVHKVAENTGYDLVDSDELKQVDSSLDKQTVVKDTNQILNKKLMEKTNQLTEMIAEHRKEIQRIQNSSDQAHDLNKQLASSLAISEAKLAEIQTHYDGLLASLENQLSDARKDVKEVWKDANQFRADLSKIDVTLRELKDAVESKEVELNEYKRNESELKKEKDLVEKERNELRDRLQEAQKEINEQAGRVTEYLSINEELLDFAQRKENEVISLTKQVQTLQQQILEKANIDTKLQADLEQAQKKFNEAQKAYGCKESENELLKGKLSDSNSQLLQQEATIATLTKQMAEVMESRDSILEEAAQFHGYLQTAKYKEFELESKLNESVSRIKDLEAKLQTMESETLKSRSELTDLKNENSMLKKSVDDKDSEALGLRKTVNDLRKKVQDLEEEVMLKEGEIAIISSSHSRDNYESF
ncbi:hypothetical protein KP509_09G078100 [Ceratopteris richardii]|uniref:Uncharacterized protein n=2 Tax=Ceratopteris richardii TaxID=49495 RepID=A0A8T2U5Q1_CERRI|nr:hypothetical protein KP509_09G078100 [Ceratopteris richardii]